MFNQSTLARQSVLEKVGYAITAVVALYLAFKFGGWIGEYFFNLSINI
jgi:hypothetical protein